MYILNMLTNFDIINICKHYDILLQGIYMKDELPSTPNNGFYIINLQSSSQGNGTHWNSLIIINKNAYFFDPFGASPSVAINNFCKGKHLGYNNWIIQNIKSENCGWYCIGLLLFLTKLDHLVTNQNFYSICNQYSNGFYSNTMKNDAILKEIFFNCPLKSKLEVM